MASEVQFVVTPSLSSNSPPSLAMPLPLLPHDVSYTAPGSNLSINLTLTDPDTIMGVTLDPFLLPMGAWIDGPTMRGARTAEASINWEPTDDQRGTHILCFEVVDHTRTKSAPNCMVVVVIRGFQEVQYITIKTHTYRRTHAHTQTHTCIHNCTCAQKWMHMCVQ